MSFNDIYPADANLNIPKRPPWSYSMSCAEVEQREEKYFKVWINFHCVSVVTSMLWNVSVCNNQ